MRRVLAIGVLALCARVASADPAVARASRHGALSGKTVYVSAGHGWYWSDVLGAWTTQRGNSNGLVEDFVSAETASQELIDELERMGAYVVPVRESDLQRATAIVDDADPGFDAGGLEPTPLTAGWGHVAEPITDATNPFAGGGSQVASGGGSGAATWTFDVPVDGDYVVYASWVADPSRAPDATYTIHHAGGDAIFVVDQRRHGGTWVRLGRFPFRAGHDPAHGAVALGGVASGTLSFDAVRIGGGDGHVARGPSMITSARPAFEDGARYQTQWNGAPQAVWDYADTDDDDDVGCRSLFTAWDHPDGEDAVYVAWHTNAPNPARGTVSFAYGPTSYGELAEFTGVPGSLELLDAVHGELIADLRADWQSDWQDRGEHTAFFGEINPAYNPETPAILIEVAFHDTPADADALREPHFRRIAARAIAEGIARYFAAKDKVAVALPPEPPTAARVTQDGGAMTIAWNPPAADAAGGDAPTGYRVYLSSDGHGFDDGQDVDGTSVAIPADLASAGPIFARVAAVGDGGESRPTPVIGASLAKAHAAVLIVAGYDALDSTLLFHEDLTSRGLGVVDRDLEDHINDGSYAARHGLAVAGARRSFDVVTRAALAEIDPSGYAAIDWLAGRDEAPWTDAERAAIAAYLAAGGRVIVSGTDVARTADPAALASLGATFGAETEIAAPIAGAAPFDGLSIDVSRAGWGDYDPALPDVLAPAGGASAAFAYAGGATAATWSPGVALVLGFPFESIGDADTRTEVMRRALDGLGVPTDVAPAPGGCACGAGAPSPPPLALVVIAFAWRRRRRRGRRA